MEALSDIFPYLHRDTADALRLCKSPDEITELRLGQGMPVIVCRRGNDGFLNDFRGRKVVTDKNAFLHSVNMLSGGSLYSIEENLKNGFVTIKGGHRVGICGSAVITDGNVQNVRDISALCFRICRQIVGCADDIYRDLKGCQGSAGCLIASPPGYGKTTVLRDLCRLIAGGGGYPPKKLGIADERCEIAAMHEGISRFDIGEYSFVCSGYPKAHAMLLMLRSMSPDIIITDEIGTADEFRMVQEVRKCGVGIIASVHALDLEDLLFRFGKNLSCFDSIFFIENKRKGHRIYRRCSGDY